MSRKLTGIRRRRGGWQVTARVNGHLYTKQFPAMTPTEEMRDWRDEQRLSRGVPALPRRRPRPRTYAGLFPQSYIYFVQCGDHVKIGFSDAPDCRLDALQCANPAPLTLLVSVFDDEVLERAIHRRFAHLRTHREWFRLAPDLVAFIQVIKDGATLRSLLSREDVLGP